ncbi:MAG TPA: acyltransferase family protein, partial [Gammaproteobacteria bacterium]|nr:acyltransferase family protein [Gammaproteobacteria bacterium]
IGVDVFFVLSGFLITYLIKEEISQGGFSFSNFYLRRIRRLMPAFFAVAFATTVAAAFLLLPDDLYSYTRSLLYSCVSLANFFFWQQDLLYFSPTSSQLPLLHIWSLAVEEQFYMLWPLFLFLCYRYFGSRSFAALTTLIFAASLVVSQLAAASFNYTSEAYYLLPSRGFEMMMGGMVALGHRRIPVLPAAASMLISGIGLLLILVPAVLLTQESIFPGLNAFWPCLGTALLITTGKNRLYGINRILGLGLLVGIGKISYSLYLWHWPVLAFMKYHEVHFNLWVSLDAIAVAFVLSYLTWRFIEKPFRFTHTYGFRTTVFRLYLLPLIVPALAYASFWYRPDGYSLIDHDSYLDASAKVSFVTLDEGWCHSAARVLNLPFQPQFLTCKKGSERADAGKALLWGDSHAGHFGPFLDYLGKTRNFSLYERSTDGCLPFLNDRGHGPNPDICNTFRKEIKDTIDRYDMVFIAARWDHLINDKDHKALVEALDFVTRHNNRVFVFLQIPVFNRDIGDCYVKNRVFGFLGCTARTAYQQQPQGAEANEKLKALLENYPGIRVIDVSAPYCDAQSCTPYLDGQPIYHDGNHLSVSGAIMLARRYHHDL